MLILPNQKRKQFTKNQGGEHFQKFEKAVLKLYINPVNIEKKYIFAPQKGSLAQLVQSICLTSRGSLVRIQ